MQDGKAEAALKEKLQEANREMKELKDRNKQLQQELKMAASIGGPSAEEVYYFIWICFC